MKNVEYAFFLTAFAATIGALIITAVNEASFNISQILLTFALVLITCIYAMRTAAIANATKEQAKASVKIAEEMKEQRIMASRPYITAKPIYEKDILEGSPKHYFSHFEILNKANGLALEVEISLLPYKEKSPIEPGSMREPALRTGDPSIIFCPPILASLPKPAKYYLVCEYQGIHSRIPEPKWYQTWLLFELYKSSVEDKVNVISGDLEFCEVSEKDRIDAFRGKKPK